MQAEMFNTGAMHEAAVAQVKFVRAQDALRYEREETIRTIAKLGPRSVDAYAAREAVKYARQELESAKARLDRAIRRSMAA